jgi:hypothetical protein
MTLRRPGRDDRRLALLWLVAAGTALALRPLWTGLAGFAGVCPLHAWTGIPCPTCGTTRAGLAFLEGRVLDALAWNPLVTLAALVFLAGGIAVPVWILAGGPLPVPGRRIARPARVAAAGVIVANWIYLFLRGV